jgi:hypothetical protein
MTYDGAAGDRCGRFEREGLPELLDDCAGDRPGERAAPSGAAAGSQRAELVAHMESCADCRADRVRYQRIARAIAELGQPVEHVPASVEQMLAVVERDGVRSRERRLRRTVQAISLILVIAVVSALFWILQ